MKIATISFNLCFHIAWYSWKQWLTGIPLNDTRLFMIKVTLWLLKSQIKSKLPYCNTQVPNGQSPSLLRQIFFAHAIKTEENAGSLFPCSPMYQIIGKLITRQQLPAQSHLIHPPTRARIPFCPYKHSNQPSRHYAGLVVMYTLCSIQWK